MAVASNYTGRVFIVDDDDEMAGLYATLLRSVALDSCRFARGDEFLSALKPDWWGCVILDLRMPGISGIDVLAALNEKASPLSVLVVTAYGEIGLAVDALKSGAINFIEKPFSNQNLLASVQAGISESRARFAQGERRLELRRRLEKLSPRERQVAELVTRGLTSKDIAEECGISLRTVEVHRASILAHLECDNSVEIATLMTEIRLSR